MRPVRAPLRVHHERRPQRTIGAQLRGAAVYEAAVRENDLVAVAGRRPCTRCASVSLLGGMPPLWAASLSCVLAR